MGNEGILRIFHLSSGSLYRSLELFNAPIWTVAFSPDGTKVLAGYGDGTVHSWTLPLGGVQIALPESAEHVQHLAVSPDGSLMATVDGFKFVTLWNLPEGTLHAAIPIDASSVVTSVGFVSGGRQILAGESGGRVHILNTSNGKEVGGWQAVDGPMDPLLISGNGELVATSSQRCVRIWNVESRQGCHEFTFERGIHSLCFSPDRANLLVANGMGVHSVAVLSGVTTAIDNANQFAQMGPTAYSPDGKWFAIGHADRTITLWNALTQTPVTTLHGHKTSVNTLAYSQDGKTLASGSGSGELKLWDLVTHQELFELQGHTGPIYTMAFSEDGHTLATAGGSRGGGGEIWLWSAPHP